MYIYISLELLLNVKLPLARYPPIQAKLLLPNCVTHSPS